ncbi:hypothetical protein GOP47_0009150 [Adiantum capillus-veneris]|uniref:Uncharacterized protein n=1 Tax=Adiantum capillus-veneris TaxID=13818 RepID=A0A9D4UWD4_ADICA|nr:hypothetical protein GOP47_0031189 [Adiantum capillus-veneris]KAI5075074.1 hypothetical protein GOP47_0009150 [Adiantum capillus-veneris]
MGVVHDVGDVRGALEEVKGKGMEEAVRDWDLGLGCEVIGATEGEEVAGRECPTLGAEWRDRGNGPPYRNLSTDSRCSTGIRAVVSI